MSVLSWFAYSSLVSALLACSAMCAESASNAVHRPRRWWWSGAIALSLVLPALEAFGWTWRNAIMVTPNDLPLATSYLPRLVIARAPSLITPQWRWLAPALLVAWGAWSLVIALRLYRAHMSLRQARLTWRPDTLDDVDVLVSLDVGPAAVGVARRAIVVPEWAMLLPKEARRVIVRHERAHVESGDTILLLAAQVAVVLQPWNIALRYAVHRLRLAVELDCDARVIAYGVDRATYGRSLLDIATYTGATPTLLATLSEPFDHLHARIVAMSARRRSRPVIAVGFALVAIVAFVAACNSERGSSPRTGDRALPNDLETAPAVVARGETLSVLHLPNVATTATARRGDAPVGGEGVRDFVADHPVRVLDNGVAPVYPAVMRKQGIEGEVFVMFVVDTSGRAEMGSLKVVKATAPEFLDAIRAVLPRMEFDPARLKGHKVRQLTQLPFTFALAPLERRRD